MDKASIKKYIADICDYIDESNKDNYLKSCEKLIVSAAAGRKVGAKVWSKDCLKVFFDRMPQEIMYDLHEISGIAGMNNIVFENCVTEIRYIISYMIPCVA